MEALVLPPLCNRIVQRATGAALLALDFLKDLSFFQSECNCSWLQASHILSAQILRSQLFARHKHINPITAFDTIPSMALSTGLSSTYSSIHVPAGTLRQRPLREISNLVPRIEQLATELTRRSRAPRRRCRSYNSYINVKPLPSNVKLARTPAVADGVASTIGALSKILAIDGWHCVACSTCNNFVSANYRACRSASVVVDTKQLDSELAST